MAVLLQAAALLALLERCGGRIVAPWQGAKVASGALLRGVSVASGRSSRLPQDLLRLLLGRLFGGVEVAGRGEARRVARALLEHWNLGLIPISVDRAVEQILDQARFLWQESFAEARLALAGEGPAGEVLLAGPAGWRHAVARVGPDYSAVARCLRGAQAAKLWSERATGGRLGRLERARRWLANGRFERAVGEVKGVAGVAAVTLRLQGQYLLGQLGPARRTLGKLDPGELTAAEAVEIAPWAQRILIGRGDPEGAREWVDAALRRARRGKRESRARAHLLAAWEAWDHGDLKQMDRALEGARWLRDEATDGWRWWQADGLRRLSEGRPEAAVISLEQGLKGRRSLRRFEAAALWNDLGVARGETGDLAGAERAFLHALRLYRGCDGPRAVTLGLSNLAEIRLRRGRLAGVEAVIERSLLENRRSGNVRGLAFDTGLAARLELARGRPAAALEMCRSARDDLQRRGLEGQDELMRLLAGRALGWLGRPDEAREELSGLGPAALGQIEPEERPALWALAGDREKAAAEIGESRLWRLLLGGEEVAPEVWRELEGLEPLRAARWVFDLELLFPGRSPARWRRRALSTLRRVGAGLLAEQLEGREEGPWAAIVRFLRAESTTPAAAARLLEEAGYSDARVVWTAGSELCVIQDGRGGPEGLEASAGGGELSLYVPQLDAVLEAFFWLIARNLEVPSTPRAAAAGGIVGESPALLQALERLKRLAPEDLPVLIRGESGTGKELFARRLHDLSRRQDEAFLAVNCSVLTGSLLLSDLFGHVRGAFTGADRDRKGVFETADRGTVFLDEIADLPGDAQGMLLRVLQEGEVRPVGSAESRRVDVRVVAASHRDLAEMALQGAFRHDLFYRLRGAAVELPALRQRGDDILLLADSILAGRGRLSAAARRAMLAHRWPGNVRELENSLKAALALSGGRVIEPRHLELLEQPVSADEDYHRAVEGFRRQLVESALERADGNRAAAARQLGLTRQALSYLVKKLDLRL
ncbi:MAG: sigma 54-interacting transcriptional regulator [Acidobacteriota bacterium]